MTQRVVSIVGPTASGKTGLGIAIARRLAEAGERAEIVNADAYQMYRGMDIGTAKPTAEEQAAVPHHLIDIIDLAGNDKNKANLEETFFRVTGTYEQRLFEDYIAQESADMRPDMPAQTDVEEEVVCEEESK